MRRSPEPIHYAWRQLCPRTGACARVMWLTARANLLGSGQPDVTFAAPAVKQAQTLKFELAAWDDRGRSTAVTSVPVLPEQVDRLDARLRATGLAAARFAGGEKPGRRVALPGGDRAPVRVGGGGVIRVVAGGRVRLVSEVVGYVEKSVSWAVVQGPNAMLNGAVRRGSTLTFGAPLEPGVYVVRMTATTADGRFVRDETILVEPTPGQAATLFTPRRGRARATASSDQVRRRAFCAAVTAAHEHKPLTISLAAGGTFTVATVNALIRRVARGPNGLSSAARPRRSETSSSKTCVARSRFRRAS